MAKIDVKNLDAFKNEKKLKLSKKPMIGIIVTCLVMGLFYSQYYKIPNVESDPIAVVTPAENPIEISVDQVNSLNVIINNSNCSDSFVSAVVEELRADGIEFTLTNGENNIDVNDAVVITLDQQYISGPGMVVLAPYDNERAGNSDALALAIKTGFYETGFFADEIQCGKMGYQQLEDGTVVERIPTETEEAIGTDKDTSFVTICFGTQNTSAELVGKAIKLSLARYANYVTNENYGLDLIYRTEIGDTLDGVSAKTGVSQSAIAEDGILLDDTVVIAAGVENLESFDRSNPVNLGGVEKTSWHK